MAVSSETGLYDPVKALLEAQGYEVKGEVGAADVVAVRDDEDPVIVELKLRFSLALFHQAVTRLSVTDNVYVAVLRPGGRSARRTVRDNKTMCRRLGIGLILVSGTGRAEVVCDPGPYAPRKNRKRKAAMLSEFHRRRGDPNTGGMTKSKMLTAYRQDALDCARYLCEAGESKGAAVARGTGIPNATRIMRDNHYGWFERISLGQYGVTQSGRKALTEWAPSG